MHKGVVFCSAALLALLLLTGASWWFLLGGRLLAVQSQSMRPVFSRGDGLIVLPMSANRLIVGDIITYRSNLDSRVLITHRMVAKRQGMLITKGDSLTQADQPVQPQQVVGRAIGVLPGYGRLAMFLHSRAGLLSALYAPVVLIIGLEVQRTLGGRRYYYKLPTYRSNRLSV